VVFVRPVTINPVGAVVAVPDIKFRLDIVRVLDGRYLFLFSHVILNMKLDCPVAAASAIIYVLSEEYPDLYVPVSSVNITFDMTFELPGKGILDGVLILELSEKPSTLLILIYNSLMQGNGSARNPIGN
jgi:hypothetical protein